MFNIFSRFLCNFINDNNKFRKQGFTLAEALIITVMTGACLLPILGTMQNAQVRTENFDHQSKMQQYSRSRLTAEIANAAFDHKSVNLEDEYHYIAYFDKNGEPDDARLIEFPRTAVTPEEIASLTNLDLKNDWSEASKIFLGIQNENNPKHYLKLVHAYKTSVETQYNVKLSNFTPGIDTEGEDVSFSSPKGLLSIVVKTRLLESDGNTYNEKGYLEYAVKSADADGNAQLTKAVDASTQIVPVTLFAFANLPTVSDEFIWMCDKHNNIVIGIDPVSKTKSSEITFPKGPDNEPLHIAVHPSGKILAVQCKKLIYLVNIDLKSPYKGNKKIILSQTEDYATKEEGGIAFRPDGKVLYYTNKKNEPSLVICGFDYSITDNVLDWNDNDANKPSILSQARASINFNNYGDKFTNIVAANDGYLYVGGNVNKDEPGEAKDKELRMVFKYPMYSPFQNGDTYQTIQIVKTDKKLNNIDVSIDGQFLLCVPKEKKDSKYKVEIYETKTGKLFKTIESTMDITYGILATYFDSSSSVQNGSMFVALSGKKGGKGTVEIYGLNDVSWRDLYHNNSEGNGNIISSPIDGKLVFNSKFKDGPQRSHNLYFSNFLYSIENVLYPDNEALILEEKKGGPALEAKSEFSTNYRDLLALALDNGNSPNQTIKMFDMNTCKELEDEVFVATYPVADLSMSSRGNMIFSSHLDEAPGCYRYNLSDYSTDNPSVSAFRRKTVFDNNYPDMAFALQYTKNANDEITNEGLVNLYYSYLDSKWETSQTDAYDRRRFNINPEWKGFDMIGLPNGGVLALYGKTDGSSMLEWIGRRNWGNVDADIGKYKLFARWTNISGSVDGNLKTLPNYSLDGWGDVPDGWQGRVAIMRDFELPVNGKVVSLNVKSVTWTPTGALAGDTSRSITPLLLELQPNGQDFKIKDVGMKIDFSNNTIRDETINIGWQKNGGLIVNSNYRLGFWNGRVVLNYASQGEFMPTPGPIPYITNSSDYAYIADYYKDGSGYGESDGVISKYDIADSNTVLKPYPDVDAKKRNYALSFNIAAPTLGFPPLYSKKLAISPDCGTLATLSKAPSEKPVLSIYDFNNYNYGPETQIEGMLVDYREPICNKDSVTNPFPKETGTPLFQKIGNKFSLNGASGNYLSTFPSLTTKNGPYWSTFADYPANFWVTSGNKGSYKVDYNKRFIGYIRPEYEVKQIQSRFSEDFRFFYNTNYIKGKTYENSGIFWPSPAPTIDCSAFSSGLLQLDQSIHAGDGFSLATYLSKVSSPSNLVKNDSQQQDTNKYKSNNDDWEVLKSSQTYIFKNRPSFITSFEVKAEDTGNGISMGYANMVFSRDRAKPVLYIKGENRLFVCYKNSIKCLSPGSGTNSKDVVISSDGQKLIFGKGNYLRVFNIANPNEDDLINGNISITDNKDNYLGRIAGIDVKANPTYLASKSFNSYNSAKLGGEYKEVTNPVVNGLSSNFFSNGSLAVANGGLYIYDGDKSIIRYNPITNESEKKDNVLKRISAKCPMTSYNDVLYLFGNDGTKNGQVQSYDLNTGESRFSFERTADTYRANLYCPSDNDPDIVTGCEPNHTGGECFQAFDGDDDTWWSTGGDKSSGWIQYWYDFNKPFVVNKIKANNNSYRVVAGVKYYDGTKKFSFYGVKENGDEIPLIENVSLGEKVTNTISFNNTVAYHKYKFEAIDTHDSGLVTNIGLAELTMYRTDLVRLTPKKSTEITFQDETNHVMKYSNSKVVDATISWSSNSSDAHFYQIYQNFGSTDATYEAYDGRYTSQSWQVGSNPSVSPYLKMSFADPEIIKFLRYSCEGGISSIHIYGSNNNDSPSVSATPANDGWTKITTLSSLPTNVKQRWIPNEISNSSKFKHYLFTFDYSNPFKIYAFEVYGEVNCINTLTSMQTDNLDKIRVSQGACCSTPYGIVHTGGIDDSNNAVATSLLYWPHAVNKYDGKNYQYGISRSLPNMNVPRYNHALVWHKGKIYAIGGQKNSSTCCSGDEFMECLDYNNSMAWQPILMNTLNYCGDYAFSTFQTRTSPAVCSFGDEIFVFDGTNGEEFNHARCSAFAYNPETKMIRKISDPALNNGTKIRLSPCSAVPFGSKIYIYGKRLDKTSTSDTSFYMLEYTP